MGHSRARFLRAVPRHLPPAPRGLSRDARRACRAARCRRPRAQAGAQSLVGRADEGGDRRVAPAPPASALSRRADNRPRCDDAEAHSHVRGRIQPTPRRDGSAHEPLHGRRPSALQARDRHPPRPDPLRRSSRQPRERVRRLQDDRRAPGERRRRARQLRRGHLSGRRPRHSARTEGRDLSGRRALAVRARGARPHYRGAPDRRRDRDGLRTVAMSSQAAPLPEEGRLRSLVDFYGTQMRTSVVAQLQYRAANYFYMLGMVAEPVIYLVVWSTIAEQHGGAVNGITAGQFAAYYIVWTLVRNMNIVFGAPFWEWRIRE